MDYRKIIKEEISKLHTAEGVEINPRLDSDLGAEIVSDICRKVLREQSPKAGHNDTVVSVAGITELDWNLIGEGDYSAEHGEYFARIEELDRANFWFQVYKKGTEMFLDGNYVQSLEQAEREVMRAINRSSH